LAAPLAARVPRNRFALVPWRAGDVSRSERSFVPDITFVGRHGITRWGPLDRILYWFNTRLVIYRYWDLTWNRRLVSDLSALAWFRSRLVHVLLQSYFYNPFRIAAFLLATRYRSRRHFLVALPPYSFFVFDIIVPLYYLLQFASPSLRAVIMAQLGP